MKKYLNTEKLSVNFRQHGIDLNNNKILITKFPETIQELDFTLPTNCKGFGRIHHFKRIVDNIFPTNPLPIDPAVNYLKQDYKDVIKVQVFQNAFCSWRCWYCFVDYDLLSANHKHSEFKSTEELVDLYLESKDRPSIIDLSGGQPDLVPEWGLWMANSLKKRRLDKKVYLWSDDNLSNEYLWKYLSKEEIKTFASYTNYGRVGCFKGFDEDSFSFNTRAEPALWKHQFKIMNRLVETGFDMYGYVTFTSDNDKEISKKIVNFIDKLQDEIHPLFPLRTVPLKIIEYTPTKHRMKEIHHKSLHIQEEAVRVWNKELEKRFSNEERSKKIFQQLIN